MRLHQIGTFRAPDGKELAYIVHLPERPISHRMAFIYLHGIESHSGWFDAAASLLKAQGFPVFCIDRRGSGINRENRGCVSGHVERGTDLLEDLHCAIREIRAGGRFKTLYLIGLSWGGKYAMAYDRRHPGEVDGLVLITPGIKPKINFTFRQKLRVLVDLILAPKSQHRIPIEPEMFTTTSQHLHYIRTDPLRLHTVSAGFLWQSRRMDKLLDRTAGAPHPPILVFLAGRDRIIDNEATRRFLSGNQDHRVTIIDYADQTHSIQLDAPERLIADVIAWMESQSPKH